MIKLKFIHTQDIAKDVFIEIRDLAVQTIVNPFEAWIGWSVHLSIVWDNKVEFDDRLSGADPLNAIELAASYASKYITGRVEDEGGTLAPCTSYGSMSPRSSWGCSGVAAACTGLLGWLLSIRQRKTRH